MERPRASNMAVCSESRLERIVWVRGVSPFGVA